MAAFTVSPAQAGIIVVSTFVEADTFHGSSNTNGSTTDVNLNATSSHAVADFTEDAQVNSVNAGVASDPLTSGCVDFSANVAQNAGSDFLSAESRWVFDFDVMTAGTMTIDYDFTIAGGIGDSPIFALTYDTANTASFAATADGTQSGTLTYSVVPSQTEQIHLIASTSQSTSAPADSSVFGNIKWSFTPSAVPEPGSFGLLAFGACGALFLRRRRRHVAVL